MRTGRRRCSCRALSRHGKDGPIKACPTTDPPTDRASGPFQTTGVAPTTGDWAPITVKRPKLPVIAGGIPVDIDPIVSRTDFNTTLFPVGPDRYRMTIFNTSSLGAINSLQWYPPVGVRVVKVLGSTAGRCG